MPTAFVFAGGGSLGAVEVGMLRALVTAAVRADFVIGSSVGAINAVQFAADPTPDGVARLERVWRSVQRRHVFPISRLGALVRLVTGRNHLVSQRALRRLLATHLDVRDLDETLLPCHVIATDLLRGGEVRFSAGSAVEALLASTAIPGVFQPICRNGRLLVDGSVAASTPVAAGIALGATRVILLPSGAPCALAEPPRGMVAIALHALTILIARQLAMDVDRLDGQAKVVVVPPLCPLDVSPYDFSRGGELIDRAAEATARWLDAGGLDAVEHPTALHPHRHAAPQANCVTAP